MVHSYMVTSLVISLVVFVLETKVMKIITTIIVTKINVWMCVFYWYLKSEILN